MNDHEEHPGPPQTLPRILVVDDDLVAAEGLATFLDACGYTAVPVASARDALEAIAATQQSPDADQPSFGVVVTDMSMPGMDGLELIRELRELRPDIAAIALTGYGTIESAVEAIRAGATDYLTKPVVDEELRMAVARALQQHHLLADNARLRRRLGRSEGLESIVGADPRMLRVYEIIEAVAPTRTTVLMTGESGTGKSLIARAIHRTSPRAARPFVELACGSIPETLLESELFGHVKGSFTGAHIDKVGKFVAAQGGTIFLDEINSASPGMQLKLLRVLQERKLEAVGSNETIEVDVRVILASNQPLEDLVARGQFRQDLYYRINVVTLELPPLRQRVGDIAQLAGHFLDRHADELGKRISGFSDDAMQALCAYRFPGNVRELQNIVERAAVLCRGTTIGRADLPEHVQSPRAGVGPATTAAGASSATGAAGLGAGLARDANGGSAVGDDADGDRLPLAQALLEPERRIILEALELNGWNRQRTAEQLAINRTTLYKKMRLHGLDRLGRAG
ncbi:MAG: sigma-54-dependent Fis family transcriptional regulator [Phycisphaerales bacterium]|nr:sigma-54-dependent Fis family transcriptional regulator [Phycisphaerales bacterium]